jgi:hypothetical protein
VSAASRTLPGRVRIRFSATSYSCMPAQVLNGGDGESSPALRNCAIIVPCPCVLSSYLPSS